MKNQPPTLLDMLTTLIGIPSVSSVNPDFDQGNRAVVEALASWLDDLGWSVDLQPLAGHPGKANLVARLGVGEGGLVLAGHTDTVPYDEGRWRQDPFRLTERDGRLYGLGTCDMKAFLGLAIEASRGLVAGDLREPLYIVATADEESSMAGAEALVQLGAPRARHAVIGEPTGLRPVRLHKGVLMEAVTVIGRSGHSSDPSLGVNALEAMHRVIAALLDWRRELQGRYHNPAFKVPVPTMNLGHIHGGDNPNRICAECELHLDLRPLPGMDLQELRAELAARAQAAVADLGVDLHTRALFDGTPAMETPAGAVIVRSAERLSGHAATAVAFGTEGPYFNALGMDTVVLGPGDIEQAHQPDEFLALDRIPPTLTLLRGLLGEHCLRNP